MEQSQEFEKKFETYADMIYRIGISYCGSAWMAEDVVQEVFLRFLKYTPSFENTIHEKAWFIRVAVNCSKKQKTNAWGRKVVPVEELYETYGSFVSAIEGENEEIILLKEQLERLPSKYRLVLYLYYFEEYSVNEIAGMLQIRPNTVSAWLSRARKKLKAFYLEQKQR